MHSLKPLLYIIRHHKQWIVPGLPIMVILLIFLSYDRFRIDGNLYNWFDRDAKQIVENEKFIRIFGSDDHLIILINNPEGIINSASLQSIKNISNALRKLPHIASVYSLNNFPYVGVNPHDTSDIIIDRLIPDITTLTPTALETIKQRIHNFDELLNRLVSDDLKTSLIVGKLSDVYLQSNELQNLVDSVQSIINHEERKTGLRYIIHGTPVLSLAFIDIAREDIQRFTPAVFLTALLLLFIAFRSWYAALLPIIVVFLTTATVMCLYALLGYSLNNFTATIPIFILAVGIADSVHIYWVWRLYRQHGYNNDDAIVLSLRKNTFSAFLTTATTFIGFATLFISDVVPIRVLGGTVALSSLFAFVYSTVYVPSFLAWRNPAVRIRTTTRTEELSCRQERLYVRYVQLLMRYYKLIIAVSAGLTAITAAGIFFVRIDSDTIKMFSSDTPVRTDFEFIQQNITGPVTLEIMIDTAAEGRIYNPSFLKHAEQFSADLKNHDPAIRHIFSLIDVLKRMHKVFNNDNPDFYTVPIRRDIIEEYFTMYTFALPQGISLNDYIDSDERYFRLSARMDALSSNQTINDIRWIKSWWKTYGYTATVNGKISLSAHLNSEVTKTMLDSVILNISIIGLLFFILFRKPSLVFFALLPNIIPLISVIGLMGWLGITIDMGLIATIVILLGVAMDATVYFIVKYRDALAKGKNISQALVYMLTYAGISNLLSTLILMVSFGMLAFSSFVPNMEFGYVTFFALLISLQTDLLLLPALLILYHKRRAAMQNEGKSTDSGQYGLSDSDGGR